MNARQDAADILKAQVEEQKKSVEDALKEARRSRHQRDAAVQRLMEAWRQNDDLQATHEAQSSTLRAFADALTQLLAPPVTTRHLGQTSEADPTSLTEGVGTGITVAIGLPRAETTDLRNRPPPRTRATGTHRLWPPALLSDACPKLRPAGPRPTLRRRLIYDCTHPCARPASNRRANCAGTRSAWTHDPHQTG